MEQIMYDEQKELQRVLWWFVGKHEIVLDIFDTYCHKSDKDKILDVGCGVGFVLSRVGCSHCQLAMQYLNAVAEELGVYIYYIDAESETYPILGTDDFDVLQNALLETLDEDEDGEKVLQTPEVFTIVDGQITSYQIGTTWTGSEYSDSDVEKLKEVYRKMITPFVK